MPALHSSSPKRLLIRGVNWLGDAVMTTPALIRLREALPESTIIMATPRKLADLWQHHPAVDEIIPLETEQGLLSVARLFRAARPDHALIFPNSPRSALETWLALIPRRTGLAHSGRGFLLTQALPPRADRIPMRKRSVSEIRQLIIPGSSPAIPNPPWPAHVHQIHEYLYLASALGAKTDPLPPRLAVSDAEQTAVLRKFGLDRLSKPVLGLNPGAEYGPAKRWPLEKFLAAAREIQRNTGCSWILLGGSNDLALTRPMEAALATQPGSALNLAGKTSLRELMCLLAQCRVLLTNDTGPMHVAAALGTPVVVPFGSTSPALTGPGVPGEARHHLLSIHAPCSPCFQRQCPIDFRCLQTLPESMVVSAVLDALSRPS